MQRMIFGLLLAGLLSAADTATSTPNIKITDRRAVVKSHVVGLQGNSSSDDAVIATVRSGGGLILNGVPTPPGVNSVVVTRGDVLQTIGAPAVATYTGGQSVSLPPATSYQAQAGTLVPNGAATQPSRVGTFALTKVSVNKH